MLAACKTLAFPQKAAKAESAIQGRSCGATALTGSRLRSQRWAVAYGAASKHRPAGARKNGHRVASAVASCFRRRAAAERVATRARRPADRIDARSARARERRSRESERAASPDAACSDGVKVPRHRRDVVPVMRLLDGVNAHTRRERRRRGPRESAHENHAGLQGRRRRGARRRELGIRAEVQFGRQGAGYGGVQPSHTSNQ